MKKTLLNIGIYFLSLFSLIWILDNVICVKKGIHLSIEEIIKAENVYKENQKKLKSAQTKIKKSPGLLFNEFMTNSELYPIVYEDLWIKENELSAFINKKSIEKKSASELIDYFASKAKSRNVNLCLWDDHMLSESMYSYNKLSSLDASIMKTILPPKEWRQQLFIDRNGLHNEKQKGFVNVYKRIEKLYGYNELQNHVQLLVLGYGRIYPTVQMITVSKEKFEFVDIELLYNFERTDGKDFRIKGCLNDDLDEVTIKEITMLYNEKKETIIDTIAYQLRIDERGEIERIKK